MGEPSPPAMEELPEDTPWAPRMDAIRQAQLAGTAALEEVFEALGSKQHSSIVKLRKQMDAMIAWKMKVTGNDCLLPARPEAGKPSAASREAAKVSAAMKETIGASGISTPSVAAEEPADQREAPLTMNVEESKDWGGLLHEPADQGM